MENNNQTIRQNKIYPWFLRVFCFILLLPFLLLPPTFEPTDWSRAILFRMVLTLLLFFLFFKYFYKKDFSFSVVKIKNPDYVPFFILSAFSFSLVLATVFSEDMRFSFFGSPGRAGGLLNYLFLFVFAVLLAVFAREKDWKTMFKCLLGTGLIISLLAFVQYSGFLKNIFISSESGRVPSFLGNATFLAIYMLFLSFLSFTLFLEEKIKKIKIIYLALFLIFIFTILITGSRATYLGILIGFVYFFFFYPHTITKFGVGVNSKLKLLKIIAASLLILAVVVVVLFNLFPQISEQNKLLKLVSSRLSVERIIKDLTGTRLVAWQITSEAIKEKPLLGFGPENFYMGFEKYYDPVPFNRQRPWWDRAHNIILETAATSGIISALLYIAFWLALLWRLGKFKKEKVHTEYAYLAHGLQAMFIGYLTALFFNFDSFLTYLISFFFIGYSFYLLSNRTQTEKIIISPIKNNLLGKKPAVAFLAISIIIFFWFYNIKPFYAALQIDYAKNLTEIGKCEKSLSIMEDIREESSILKSYAGLRYSDFLKTCANLSPEKETEYAAKGMESLKVSSAFQPKFTRTWLFMGSFTNILAAREQNNVESRNKLLSEARDYLNKA
ncbi:MAG: O-antigen ligase family protein, partial [Candidatus Staskawiczbacteria bacterium]|nr:O-antigen ligase family protein [Candidatus Staskawiczbacteria bacterium]